MTRGRWMSVVVTACLAATVLVLSYAAGKGSSPEVVRAQRFELVDSAGNVRGLLSLGDRACPRLVLFDEEGDARARLMLHLDGTPMLSLYDQKGTGGVALMVEEGGPRGLHLRDKEGILRATVCDEGIELRGRDRSLTWSAP
jgi:hypothetical protein